MDGSRVARPWRFISRVALAIYGSAVVCAWLGISAPIPAEVLAVVCMVVLSVFAFVVARASGLGGNTTLWIGTTVAVLAILFPGTSGGRALQLLLSKPAHGSIEDVVRLRARVAELDGAHVLTDEVGHASQEHPMRYRTRSVHGQWVAPLVSDTWREGDPVHAWAGCRETDETAHPGACRERWARPARQIIVPDGAGDSFDDAIAEAIARDGLRADASAPVYELTDDSQDEIRARVTFGITVPLIVGVLWIPFVLWASRRRPAPHGH